MGHMSFVFPNGVIQAPLPHTTTMVLPPKKLPASTTSRHASPKPKRLQKTELGELRSTPTKPPPAPKKTSSPSGSVLTTSTILILLALLSVLYIQYACPAGPENPVCTCVSTAQEWAAPHLAFASPYLDKIRGYVERVDELGAPYLARTQGILREVWERNVQPHVRTIWEKVQGEVEKRR